MTRTPEDNRARVRAWKKANPEKYKAGQKRWRQKHQTKYMRAWRRKKLAAPPPYEPPECCEACGRKLVKPNLDHCHLTGLFRGWLCNPCNAALGLAGDTPEGVSRLLDYITLAYAKLEQRMQE